MRKFLKIILSLFSAVILSVLLVPVLLTILMSSYRVQNYAATKATEILSRYLETTVSIDRIRIKLFNRVSVDGLYVEDLQGDTLIYVGNLDAGFRSFNPRTGIIRLGDVRLQDGEFRLRQNSTLTMNIKYITEKLKRDPPRERNFRLRANNLLVDNLRFTMEKYERNYREEAVDFTDLDIRDIHLDLHGIVVNNDDVSARIKKISFTEKSGFVCENLSASRARVHEKGLWLENLSIRDTYSDIHMTELRFEYEAYIAYKEFVDDVRMYADLQDSRIAFASISYFAPKLKPWETVLRLDGSVNGTIRDFSGKLDDVRTTATRFVVAFHINGLPDVDQTIFTVDLERLETDSHEITTIIEDITGNRSPQIEKYLRHLHRVVMSGHFKGFQNDFKANAVIHSQPGDVAFDIRMNPDVAGRTRLTGHVDVQDFDLGQLLAVENLGKVSVEADVDGSIGADSLIMKTDTRISSLVFNDYVYSGIDFDGEIRNSYYKGYIGSADPNLKFDFNGSFDFNGELPRYDFSMDLVLADLHALHINRRDSVSRLSGQIRANATGARLDQIDGSGYVRNLIYEFPGDTLRANEITFVGDNFGENKLIALYSDFADIELHSRMNFVDLIPYATNTLRYYLPSLDSVQSAGYRITRQLDSLSSNSTDNYYVLKGDVKESGKFASALLPGLYIEQGTNFSFLLNPVTHNFSLILNSDLIEYDNIYVTNLNLTNRNQADSIAVYIRTDEMGIGNFYMPGLSVNGGIKNNLINLSTGFRNPLNNMSAMINTVTRVRVDPQSGRNVWNLRFGPSQINIADQQWWVISPGIELSDQSIDVSRFRIYSAGQDLSVHGTISQSPADTLHISLTNFDLSPLSGIIDRLGYRLEGKTNGHADLISGKGEKLFHAAIRFDDIRVNGQPIQNTLFRSFWDADEDIMRMLMALDSGQEVVSGSFRPSDKRYFFRMNFPDIDLVHLEPVLNGVLDDITGEGNAALTLSGIGGDFSLNGKIDVRNFASTVDFTQARYYMDQATVEIENNNLFLRNAVLTDGLRGEANVGLTLRTQYLTNMEYDVTVHPRGLLALNTQEKDNDVFYGRAFASGDVRINGDRRGTRMNIEATTDDNSVIYMPLTDRTTIAEADFIVFEDPNRVVDTTEVISRGRLRQMMRERRRSRSEKNDLDINIRINVRPNTEVQLVFDQTLGDILRARGNGQLDMHVRPKEEIFTMSGNFEVTEGTYLFTAMNFLNKRFVIVPGSTIQWIGDPLNAILNITAVYNVRASIDRLVSGIQTSNPNSSSNVNTRQSVPVETKIILTDRLTQPTINFDVDVPNVDSELRSIVQSAMNTQELKSQQFVWLLATNSFYVDNSIYGGANIGTTATTVTGLEFVTNQLSNWLSTDRFNFNFGYRPRSDFSSDEVEASFSGEIIPNKLLFETEINYNLGNTKGEKMTDNQFAGDFAITYIFDRIGNLRGKIFTRTIDRFDENQGLQETGVGLYYKKDFENFRELFVRRNRKKLALANPFSEQGDEEPDILPREVIVRPNETVIISTE